MVDAALVLEGGSLRCLFTAGVLDVLMKNKIAFSYVNGVSAGSLCALNFLSLQIGRTRDVNLEYAGDERYLGMKNYLQTGGVFNFDFLFGELAHELEPYHFDTFAHSKSRMVAVATNCNTGKAQFFEKGDTKDMFLACRASCSMPLLSQIVTIDGQPFLDGGIACPIAIDKAMEENYPKTVVVTTREKGFRKTEENKLMLHAYERKYQQFPQLVEVLKNRVEHYNALADQIDLLEERGKIFVIRPDGPVNVSRTERDIRKLKALYLRGVYEMGKRKKEMLAYLNS